MSRRTSGLGVRLAIGASPASVSWLVLARHGGAGGLLPAWRAARIDPKDAIDR